MLLFACGGEVHRSFDESNSALTKRDFTIGVSPASQQLADGASVAYTVKTGAIGGSETVRLSVTGLPLGVTASFSPASVGSGNSSRLTLTAAANAMPQTATLTVIGSANTGNHNATASVTVVDGTPPVPQVTAPAANAQVSGTVMLAGNAVDNIGVTLIELSVDGAPGAWAAGPPLSASWDSTSFPDGTHSVVARATDAAGNTASTAPVPFTVSNSAATRDFAISLAQSRITIADGSTASFSGTTATMRGAPQSLQLFVSGLPAGITGTISPPTVVSGGGFTVTLTADASVPTIGDAPFTVAATGVYATRSAPASVTVIDTIAPVVSLSPADGATLSGVVTVTGIAHDNLGVTLLGSRLFLDGAPLGIISVTTVSWDTTAASDGAHTLSFTAADGAGNQSIAVSAVTVRNSALTRDFSISVPATLALATGASWGIEVRAPTVIGAPQPIRFSLSGVPPGVTMSVDPATILSDGGAVLRLAADANAPVVESATVLLTGTGVYTSHSVPISLRVWDHTPPTVSLAPADGATLWGTVAFTVTASDNVAVTTCRLRVDGRLIQSFSGLPCSLPLDTTALADGPHTLSAEVLDDALNLATASSAVTVDNRMRDFTVALAPASQSVGGGGTVVYTIATAATVGAPDTITLSAGTLPQGLAATLGSAQLLAGDSTTLTVHADSTILPGDVTLTISALGKYASRDATAALAVLDVFAPKVVFAMPAADQRLSGLVDITAAAQDNVRVARAEIWLDGAPVAQGLSWTWDTTTAADGPHSLEARAWDDAGNLGSSGTVSVQVVNDVSTRDFSVSLDPSQVTVAQGDLATLTLATATLTGAAEPLTLTARIGRPWPGVTLSPANLASGSESTITISPDFNGPAGSVTLFIDVCGVYTCHTVSSDVVVVDVTPPSLTLISPAAGDTVSGWARIKVSASDNSNELKPIAILVDGLPTALLATGDPSWDTTQWPDGPHLLTALASDTSGNTASASAQVTILNSQATRDFSLSAPAVVDISVDRAEVVALSTAEIAGAPELLRLSAVAPDGIQVTFDPEQILAGGVASATISPFTPGAAGDIIVTATGVYASHSTSINIVNVAEPPSILLSPPPGTVLSGTQPVGGTVVSSRPIVTAEVLLDSAVIGTPPSWNAVVALDTTAVADGPHTLSLRATMQDGTRYVQEEAVVVQNSAATRDFAIVVAPPAQNASSSGSTALFVLSAPSLIGAPQDVLLSVSGPYPFVLSADHLTPGASASLAVTLPAGIAPGRASFTISAAGVYRTATDVAQVDVLDTTPPAVAVTSPTAATTLSGAVLLAANATDNDRVAGVRFFLDNAPLPSASWDTTTAPDGVHQLWAVATDPAGNSGTSSKVAVTVANNSTTRAFTIELSPSPDVRTVQSSVVTFTITTAEVTGAPQPLSLSAVCCYPGITTTISPTQIMAGESATMTVTVSANAPPVGSLLQVLAYGVYRGVYAYTTLIVDDVTAPTVSLSGFPTTRPLAGTYGLFASAADSSPSPYGVTSMTLLLDGAVLKSSYGTPVNATLDTTTLADGPHTFVVTATDYKNNVGTGTWPVSVQNSSATRDFSGSVSPGSGAIGQGGWMQFALSTAESYGAPEPLQLSVTAPPGVTATLASSTLTAGQKTTLKVSAVTGAQSGDVQLTIAGVYATRFWRIPLTVQGFAPQVAVAPQDGSVAVGTATLSANAQDMSGSGLARLELLLDGTVLRSSAGDPLTATWDTTAAPDRSAHTVLARATDNQGTVQIATSTLTVQNSAATRDFSLSAPPSTVLGDGSSTTVTISTAEISGTPQTLSFSFAPTIDGPYSSFSPATVTAGQTTKLTLSAWNGLPPGTINGTITATGLYTSHSVPITVQVVDGLPPLLTLQPGDGSIVAGRGTIMAQANDNIGIASCEVDIDGTQVKVVGPYQACYAPWDTTGIAEGAHVVSARAVDTSGNVTLATSHVTVMNAPTSGELVYNGGFELPRGGTNAAGWNFNQTYPLVVPTGHSGQAAAKLLASVGTTATLSQILWIPASSTSVTLSLWYAGAPTAAGVATNWQEVALYDRNGVLIGVAYHGLYQGSAWTRLTADLSSLRGTSVELRIKAVSASAASTVFLVDDVSVQVTPDAVGDSVFCRAAGNVLYLDGSAGDWVHPGIQTITGGTWYSSVFNDGADISAVHISTTAGGYWTTSFALDPMTAGKVAEGAVRSPAVQAAIDVSGNGRGCNQDLGRWEIEDLLVDSTGTLRNFTATFEQSCEMFMPVLRGCVHFEQ